MVRIFIALLLTTSWSAFSLEAVDAAPLCILGDALHVDPVQQTVPLHAPALVHILYFAEGAPLAETHFQDAIECVEDPAAPGISSALLYRLKTVPSLIAQCFARPNLAVPLNSGAACPVSEDLPWRQL